MQQIVPGQLFQMNLVFMVVLVKISSRENVFLKRHQHTIFFFFFLIVTAINRFIGHLCSASSDSAG